MEKWKYIVKLESENQHILLSFFDMNKEIPSSFSNILNPTFNHVWNDKVAGGGGLWILFYYLKTTFATNMKTKNTNKSYKSLSL